MVENLATFMEVANCPQMRCIQHGAGRDAGTVLVGDEIGSHLASWKGESFMRIVRNRRVEAVERDSHYQRGALRYWRY